MRVQAGGVLDSCRPVTSADLGPAGFAPGLVFAQGRLMLREARAFQGGFVLGHRVRDEHSLPECDYHSFRSIGRFAQSTTRPVVQDRTQWRAPTSGRRCLCHGGYICSCISSIHSRMIWYHLTLDFLICFVFSQRTALPIVVPPGSRTGCAVPTRDLPASWLSI